MVVPYYCPSHPNMDVQMTSFHVGITTIQPLLTMSTQKVHMWEGLLSLICGVSLGTISMYNKDQNLLNLAKIIDFAKWQLHMSAKVIHKVLQRGIKCEVFFFEEFCLLRARLEDLKSELKCKT